MDISGSFPDGRNRPEDAPKQATNGAHGPQNTGPSATTQGLRKSLLYKVDDIFRADTLEELISEVDMRNVGFTFTKSPVEGIIASVKRSEGNPSVDKDPGLNRRLQGG